LKKAHLDMDLVDQFWQILRDAGWVVLNYRENNTTREELLFVMRSDFFPPYVPAGSQTVRIVTKGKSWFFIYAHANTPEHGFWGVRENVFNQIRGQTEIKWAMVFLKESAAFGWWATPENVNLLIRHGDWNLSANGTYLVNYDHGRSRQ
jgi:hypothetical protein